MKSNGVGMLPYENAKSGKTAIQEIQKLLKNFGATKFGITEDFESGMVSIQFNWRNQSVLIEASIKGYAAAWLRQHPWTTRKHITEHEHKKRALEQANISVYSILRDWIKGQITAVEIGMLSFEAAFLGNLLLTNGETILQRIQKSDLLKISSS